MNFKKTALLFFVVLGTIFSIGAQTNRTDKKIGYKAVAGDSLYLHVFEPQVSKKPRAVIVFFFGGGWVGGTPKQFYQQSEYFAARGMLAIAAEYRIHKTHGTSPFECVEDGKSAIRWVREHHRELNIDPDRIVAAGGSAGGHIALCTALIDGLDNPTENKLISSVPNAVVGYNPVFDTTEKGYGSEKVAGRQTEISPCHQIKKEMPPMVLFHGKEDATVPFENATRFTRLMKEAGNECELVAVDNVSHGFFNGDFFREDTGDKYYNLTTYQTDVFLRKLGYLKNKPTLVQHIKKIACVGDSNTEAKYPEFLQEKIGKKYHVKNFGKGGATLLAGTTHPYFEKEEYRSALKFVPDIVIIMFGTNDANVKWCLDESRKTKFIGTPQEEFKSQYVRLIESFKEKNEKAEIYIVTPLPIYEHEKSRDPKIKQRITHLNQWVIPIIKELAEEQKVKLIDVNQMLKNGFKYTTDGVHLTKKGYKVLAKKITKKII